MIDPVTTTLAYDRQQELLQQAESDHLLHRARSMDPHRRRFSFGVRRVFGRLARPHAPIPPVLHEDTPTAA